MLVGKVNVRRLSSRQIAVVSQLSFQRTATTVPTNEPNEEQRVSATVKRVRAELAADKQRLQWRTPIGTDWNSRLKLFSNNEQTSDYIVMMQKPIDLSPSAIRQWWDKRKEKIERQMQQYIPERHEILGPDLAAAHFVLYRGGAVKFVNDTRWHRADEDGEFNLPNKYQAGYKVEALRCDNMNLYYEGLENIRGLDKLKFLSFHNVTNFDNWCLDRVSGSQYPHIEVLDVSGTSITSVGLSCMYRLPTLKLFIVDDPKKTLEFELACAMLEEALPNLKIVGADAIHEVE